MKTYPAGTVTFLLTDIEGSTRLLHQLGERYDELLVDHHRLLRTVFARHGGSEVDVSGDGLFYVFPSARDGIGGAVDALLELARHEWPGGSTVRVRIGLHTGEPMRSETGFVGLDVHRVARIAALGHGGQILVSKTTRDVAGAELPFGARLVDLGEHRLKDFPGPERLYQVVAAGLAAEFPPLRSVIDRPNNLPRQLTPFVGRKREIAEAIGALDSAPLVTLTGPGGVGKTRLAVRVASEMLESFEDGVWLVELAGLADPSFLIPTLAATLGIAEDSGSRLEDTVIAHLAVRHMLLVLDNCEHVLEQAAATSAALLARCPSLRILATSREGLGVVGERLLPVPSLSLPDASRPLSVDRLGGFEAVELFVDRARAAAPTFGLNDANAAAVAQLCRRLDGIPLALELAAARARVLTVDQIADRLDDRFRLLTGSSRLSVARHQTLRATIDWSFDLLEEEERAVLRRTSVFAGSFSLDAAEAVCAGGNVAEADVLDIVSRLVDKSLLVAGAAQGDARYRLLETVRQYARDRLLEAGEAPIALRAHRDWFLSLGERAALELFRGPESASWLARLDDEHDNLRAALQWSEDEPGEAGAGLALAARLWRFWEIRGHVVEGSDWLGRMLAATSGDASVLRADALTGAGVLALMRDDLDSAAALHEESLELHRRLGDPVGIAYAANNLANTAMRCGDHGRALSLYQQAMQQNRDLGNLRGVAFALVNMADAVALTGDEERARQVFEESLATFRQLRDRWGEAFALDAFGPVALRQGHPDQARELHEAARAISEELGDERGVARALLHLGDVAASVGDAARAVSLYRQSLAVRQSLGDAPGIALALEQLAWVVGTADPLAAARLLGAAEGLRESTRVRVPSAARAHHDARVRDLVRASGDAFDDALRAGRSLTVSEVLATLPP